MRWVLALLVFAATAAIGHFVVLHAIPAKIMSTAQTRMAERGVPLHDWAASPRMTPQTQTIVRPSPDLFYALCRFDTSEGPVRLSAPLGETYGSLSVFDSRTNNVFVTSLLEGSGFGEVIVHAPGERPATFGEGKETVELEGPGLALIRRLAPSPAAFDAANALMGGAVCELADDL